MIENTKNSIIRAFKMKTEQQFHKIDGICSREIEDIVLSHIENMIEKYALDAEVLNIAIIGTRCRGLEKENSDLDIVVELSSDHREDDLFCIFNEDKLYIKNIEVDINPITMQKTGSLDAYLLRAEDYLEKTYKRGCCKAS